MLIGEDASVGGWTRKSVSVGGRTRKSVGWTRKSVSVEGWTRKSVWFFSMVGWKRGESGGGCGGGSGEATLCGGGGSSEGMMDAGVKSDEAVTNFCPGQRVPSLQVGVTGRRVRAVKVTARAGEEVVGGGHSAGVVGQQSQSISSSIWSSVRLLLAAYIV